MKRLQKIHTLKNKLFKNNDEIVVQRTMRVSLGFTLIEMVVVVVIFSVIASVVLYNTRQYSNRASLESLTQDIALAIRNVQVEAVSGRYVGTPFTIAPSYGVYFKTGPGVNSFVHFADFNNNKVYNGSVVGCGTLGNECLEEIFLPSGYTVSCIEATLLDTGVMLPCTASVNKYSITFTRPESYPTTTGVSGGSLKNFSDTTIYVKDKNESQASIHLWSTGQIEVE